VQRQNEQLLRLGTMVMDTIIEAEKIPKATLAICFNSRLERDLFFVIVNLF